MAGPHVVADPIGVPLIGALPTNPIARRQQVLLNAPMFQRPGPVPVGSAAFGTNGAAPQQASQPGPVFHYMHDPSPFAQHFGNMQDALARRIQMLRGGG